MSKSNKRTLADLESTPFPPTKRARTQLATPLPPATESALQTPSSPTLIGSIPTSSPSQSPQSSLIDATDSATSSSTSTTTSSSVETSSSEPSSDDSSSNSETRYMQNHFIPFYPVPNSTSTSDTETTSSCPTSTSASIADDVSGSSSSSPTSTSASTTDVESGSSSSASDSQSSSASISSSSSEEESASSSSDMRRTLTAKNLATLQRRLDSLLPTIQSANELLEVERREGKLEERNIENVANEDAEGGRKGYIAMELGLGVLEERREMRAEAHKMGTTSGSESDTSSGQQEAARDEKGNVIGKVTRTRGLGGKRKAMIEEVGGG